MYNISVLLFTSCLLFVPVACLNEFFQGNVEASEMATTFNCGIGMVLIVSEGDKDAVLQQLRAAGEQAVIVGDVQPAANGIMKRLRII